MRERRSTPKGIKILTEALTRMVRFTGVPPVEISLDIYQVNLIQICEIKSVHVFPLESRVWPMGSSHHCFDTIFYQDSAFRSDEQ